MDHRRAGRGKTILELHVDYYFNGSKETRLFLSRSGLAEAQETAGPTL